MSAASQTGMSRMPAGRAAVATPRSGVVAAKPTVRTSAATTDAPVVAASLPAPKSILKWKEPSGMDTFSTNTKLAFALPWRRIKNGSVLVIKLEGAIAEMKQPRLSNAVSMPAITEALRKAAYDPRITGVYFDIDILGAGWAKIQEIRTYIEFFKKSGKFTMAYMKRGGEKEYFLATACDEIYIPPTAQLSLRGLAVEGSFLRGVLDKVGVEPQIKRIGNYKSAGDQLLRRDMSEFQREQLSALLDDIFDTFVDGIAKSRKKTRDEVIAMLDKGIYDMEEFKSGGWVNDLKYSDEINTMMEGRTGGKDDQITAVKLAKYKNVSSSAFGLTGKKVIAIVRAQGNITGGSKASSGSITSEPLVAKLRSLAKDKKIAGIVLRVDSPGGDALASDLMWREIRELNKKKPIIATMGDVAASGGYYMAMAAPLIVAAPLTITGSIGVITGKFNLEELFTKVGYSKEVVSRGQYAELLQDYRSFNDAEEKIFDDSATFAYESFRNKAAESRGMEPLEMQEFAQGRVWSGIRALDNNLIDHLGAMDTAIALLKEKLEISEDEQVTLLEVSKGSVGPLDILSSATGSKVTQKELALLVLTDPALVWGTLGFTVLPFMLQMVAGSLFDQFVGAATSGQPQASMPEVFSSFLEATHLSTSIFPQASMQAMDIKTSVDASSGITDLIKGLIENSGR